MMPVPSGNLPVIVCLRGQHSGADTVEVHEGLHRQLKQHPSNERKQQHNSRIVFINLGSFKHQIKDHSDVW